MNDRLVEIRLLTDKDVYVREFAKQTFITPQKSLAMSDKEKKVLQIAAEARVRRAKDSL